MKCIVFECLEGFKERWDKENNFENLKEEYQYWKKHFDEQTLEGYQCEAVLFCMIVHVEYQARYMDKFCTLLLKAMEKAETVVVKGVTPKEIYGFFKKFAHDECSSDSWLRKQVKRYLYRLTFLCTFCLDLTCHRTIVCCFCDLTSSV